MKIYAGFIIHRLGPGTLIAHGSIFGQSLGHIVEGLSKSDPFQIRKASNSVIWLSRSKTFWMRKVLVVVAFRLLEPGRDLL